jgi:hypothetical protein
MGTGTGVGLDTLNRQFSDWAMTKNAIIGVQAAGVNPSVYPTGNFWPADYAAVQFVDYAGSNLRLATGSPYKNAGTDGKDLGANIDSLPSRGATIAFQPPTPRPPTAVQIQ